MLAILWRYLPTLGRTPSYGPSRGIRDYHATPYNWPAPRRKDEADDVVPDAPETVPVVEVTPAPVKARIPAPRAMGGVRLRPMVAVKVRPMLYPSVLLDMRAVELLPDAVTDDGLAAMTLLLATDDF